MMPLVSKNHAFVGADQQEGAIAMARALHSSRLAAEAEGDVAGIFSELGSQVARLPDDVCGLLPEPAKEEPALSTEQLLVLKI